MRGANYMMWKKGKSTPVVHLWSNFRDMLLRQIIIWSYSMISFNSKGYYALFMPLPWVKTNFEFRNSAIDIKCLIKSAIVTQSFHHQGDCTEPTLTRYKEPTVNPPVIHFISAKSLKEISLQQYVIFHTGYEMQPVTPCRFYFKHFFSGEAAIIPRFDSLSTWSLITFRSPVQ